jgi:hypothetical protein
MNSRVKGGAVKRLAFLFRRETADLCMKSQEVAGFGRIRMVSAGFGRFVQVSAGFVIKLLGTAWNCIRLHETVWNCNRQMKNKKAP